MKKLWYILLPAERRKVLGMLVMVVLMAVAETVGVISITPFLSVLGRPDIIRENPALMAAYNTLGFAGSRDFTIALGLLSIVLVIASSVFKTVTLHLVNRFVHLLRHSLSARLLSLYLHQPYEFFLDRNPAILSKNVLSEVDQLLFDLVQPLSQLVAQGVVVVAMTLVVFLYDPLMAICIVGVLGLLYGIIYGLVRKRLEVIGGERRDANGLRYKACNEVFGGIKDVKVTHSAAAYQRKFNEASRLLSRHSATSETLNQSPLYIVESVGYSGLILIALLLLLRSNDIGQVLPALGLYGFAAYRMLPAAQVMYRGLAKLKFSTAALNAIHSDFQLLIEGREGSSTILPLKQEIRLQGIRYAY
ncbi:MAG: ABC transporter transmembrane domain-containing protein, partial [Parahaliea sp.]